MKAKDFPEANIKIAKDQQEYQTLPAKNTLFTEKDESGNEIPVTIESVMCFELDEAELKQVQDTGCIWLKIYRPVIDYFHPIGIDVLKPEGIE